MDIEGGNELFWKVREREVRATKKRVPVLVSVNGLET